MNSGLEIIIATRNSVRELAQTAASLAAQTDREFGVLISDNFSTNGVSHLDAARRQLVAAGIAVRRVKAPFELQRVEHWNWAHAQSQAAWLKPLHPGEQLKPGYVARLKERIAARPGAQIIRCDLEERAEWGPETQAAPFAPSSITPTEFTTFFPAHMDWLSHSINFAFGRTAWLATGGYSPQLPGCAALNLHVILALHYGLENISEVLATVEVSEASGPHRNGGEQINRSMEKWMILRQAENYCRSVKLPWSSPWPASVIF